MKQALAIALLVSALAFPQQAATEPCVQGRLLAEELLSTEHLPGLQFAVLDQGLRACSVAIGYSNLEHRVPVTEITRFRIGSISKTLTSAALGLLVEEGRLDLDAPIQKYVPTFPEKEYPITTRQLAGHLSGLPHYGPEDFINTTHYPDVIAALDKFKDRDLLFEPGDRFQLFIVRMEPDFGSAPGSGRGRVPRTDADTRVFRPLGMPHTVADHYAQLIPHRTAFYEVVGGPARRSTRRQSTTVTSGPVAAFSRPPKI